MTMITIEVDDHKVLSALARMHERVQNVRPLLKSIGEHLQDTTLMRFNTSTAPEPLAGKHAPHHTSVPGRE